MQKLYNKAKYREIAQSIATTVIIVIIRSDFSRMLVGIPLCEVSQLVRLWGEKETKRAREQKKEQE